MSNDSLRYGFFGIWLLLLAGNLFILFGTKHIKLKKALLPAMGVLAGIGILVFLALAGFSRWALYSAVPVAIVFISLNLRQFTICDQCGCLVRGEFFAAPTECPNCHANLGTH